ncbi:MAG: type III secretion system gatekeeper subunit SctW [Planctomycetaceae bacterium]
MLAQMVSDDMSFVLGSRISKKLAQRKFSDDSRLRRSANKSAKHASEKSNGVVSVEALSELFDLAQSTDEGDESAFLAKLTERFPDTSQQDAALDFLLEFLESQELDPELQDALRNQQQTLREEHGPQIRAGFNVAQTVDSFSQTGLGDSGQLRDFYREQVIGYTQPQDVYNRILSQFGETRFEQAVEFLMQGLGSELQSSAPSISTEHLKAIVDDISMVQVTRNLLLSLQTVLARMQNTFGIRGGATAQRFLTESLDLKSQRWIDESQIKQMAVEGGAKTLEQRIYFLREMRNVIRELPDRAFHDNDDRNRVNDAFQLALDQVIEEEDAR